MADVKEKQYTGYGYHGGGRKSLGDKAKNVTISVTGTRAEIDSIKQKAKLENKSVSRYVIDNLLR